MNVVQWLTYIRIVLGTVQLDGFTEQCTGMHVTDHDKKHFVEQLQQSQDQLLRFAFWVPKANSDLKGRSGGEQYLLQHKTINCGYDPEHSQLLIQLFTKTAQIMNWPNQHCAAIGRFALNVLISYFTSQNAETRGQILTEYYPSCSSPNMNTLSQLAYSAGVGSNLIFYTTDCLCTDQTQCVPVGNFYYTVS